MCIRDSYMSQHHLLDSNIHLASFDDHYLYDSLSLRIDTVQQDNRQLAWHCYDPVSYTHLVTPWRRRRWM